MFTCQVIILQATITRSGKELIAKSYKRRTIKHYASALQKRRRHHANGDGRASLKGNVASLL